MKKKEQFSIALWDRLQKDNIPHSFETRNGDEVTQLHIFDGEFHYPIHGVHDGGIESWMKDGVYGGDSNQLDLFIVWEEEQLMLEGWLYIYPDNSAHFVKTPLPNPSKHIDAIKKVSIPYTKGEGLNNG